jgi:hypothetical protein
MTLHQILQAGRASSAQVESPIFVYVTPATLAPREL